MSISAIPVGTTDAMSKYEREVWIALEAHWNKRANKQGLPNWVSSALDRAGTAAAEAGSKIADATPAVIKKPVQQAGEAMATSAVKPALKAATGLLELTNAWVADLTDPRSVEKLAAKRDIKLGSFVDLKSQDLKQCDRLLTRNTLKWRTLGALEGGAMGALALVPVAGLGVSITADIFVIQALSVSIATRIAYSYGFDANDPAEQEFVQRLVRRSFIAQAAKAKPLKNVNNAVFSIKGRVRWSEKLRTDHHLIAALEKLMQQIGPAGARVPVQSVGKVLPFIGIVIGAGTNAVILGNVAADAQRFCQTRFLCEKYDIPLPTALSRVEDLPPAPH